MMWHAATEKSFLVYLIRPVRVLVLRGGIVVDKTSHFEQINRWPLLSRCGLRRIGAWPQMKSNCHGKTDVALNDSKD